MSLPDLHRVRRFPTSTTANRGSDRIFLDFPNARTFVEVDIEVDTGFLPAEIKQPWLRLGFFSESQKFHYVDNTRPWLRWFFLLGLIRPSRS